VFAAASEQLDAPASVDAVFDDLRWFALPSICLTPASPR